MSCALRCEVDQYKLRCGWVEGEDDNSTITHTPSVFLFSRQPETKLPHQSAQIDKEVFTVMSNHPPTNATDAAISPEPTYPPCKRARVTTSDKGNATTWSEPATLAYCTACQSVQPVIIQETESEEPISVASTSGQAAEAHNPASESNDATGIQSAQPFENHEAAPEGHDTIASPLARFAVIHDPSRQNDEPQAVNTQSVEPAVAQEPQPEDDGSTIIEDSDNGEFNAWHFPLPEDDDMLEAVRIYSDRLYSRTANQLI